MIAVLKSDFTYHHIRKRYTLTKGTKVKFLKLMNEDMALCETIGNGIKIAVRINNLDGIRMDNL